MLDRPRPDLSEQDCPSLVTNEVAEGRDIEFKRELPGGSPATGTGFQLTKRGSHGELLD